MWVWIPTSINVHNSSKHISEPTWPLVKKKCHGKPITQIDNHWGWYLPDSFHCVWFNYVQLQHLWLLSSLIILIVTTNKIPLNTGAWFWSLLKWSSKKKQQDLLRHLWLIYLPASFWRRSTVKTVAFEDARFREIHKRVWNNSLVNTDSAHWSRMRALRLQRFGNVKWSRFFALNDLMVPGHLKSPLTLLQSVDWCLKNYQLPLWMAWPMDT